MSTARSAEAFAPASIANVAVGFDVLGFAFGALGDHVEATRAPAGAAVPVAIDAIEGAPESLPTNPAHNTAAVAVARMRDALGLTGSFALRIRKGIPLASGLGGSAASAVAAVVAANALVDEPLPHDDLLEFAVAGEAAASGDAHADNVAPSLCGGLVAVLGGESPRAVPIDVALDISCVVVRPQLEIETQAARAALNPVVALRDHTAQCGRLAAFVAACLRGDADLLRRSMRDGLIEPQRAGSIPGFAGVQRAAIAGGAFGCSIAGSGPSVFAWTAPGDAEAVGAAMRAEFRARDLESDAWVEPLGAPGARLVTTP